MLILKSQLRAPERLAFSPDGLSLAAGGDDRVQVWPRWPDAPPRPVVADLAALHDFAFAPDGKRLFLYMSGNSRTRALDVAKGKHGPCGVPASGPSWFHFDAVGGFFLACHGRGNLSRLDYAPTSPRRVEKRWTVARKTLGSHYLFGGVCAAAGVFVAMEYKFGAGEPVDGLVARSVEDGAILYRRPLKSAEERLLLKSADRRLALHPSGTYFAFPVRNEVRLWPLADGVEVPEAVPNTARSQFRAVAFHPSGTLLAAGGTEGTVKLYDTTTWRVARAFAWKAGGVRALCFSADGTRAAAATDAGQVIVWDLDL